MSKMSILLLYASIPSVFTLCHPLGNVVNCFVFFFKFVLGLLSQPKWGHLKDLHAAIKLCEPALVAADSPQYMKLGPQQEVCPNLISLRIMCLIFCSLLCCHLRSTLSYNIKKS